MSKRLTFENGEVRDADVDVEDNEDDTNSDDEREADQ